MRTPTTNVVSLEAYGPISLSGAGFIGGAFLRGKRAIFARGFNRSPKGYVTTSKVVVGGFSSVFFRLELSGPILLPIFFRSKGPCVVATFQKANLRNGGVVCNGVFRNFVVFVQGVFSRVVRGFVLRVGFSLVRHGSGASAYSSL